MTRITNFGTVGGGPCSPPPGSTKKPGWNRLKLLVDYFFSLFSTFAHQSRKKRGIWGRKRGTKEKSTAGSPRCTHTDNEGVDDEDSLFDFSKERSTTRIGGQQLHLHESPTKDNRRNKRKD